MVSSVCADPDPDRPLAHGTAIVFFPLQPSGEGGRFGFFPAPCTALHDPRKLAGLCGYPFLNQLVSWAALHATACRRHVVVSWPSLCIVAWGVTTPTSICLAIQVETSLWLKEMRFCLSWLEADSSLFLGFSLTKGRMIRERSLPDPLSEQGEIVYGITYSLYR